MANEALRMREIRAVQNSASPLDSGWRETIMNHSGGEKTEAL